MPLTLDVSNRILLELAKIRKNKSEMLYLRPDAKSQVTFKYEDDWKPIGIETVVVSTQHDEFILPANDSPEALAKAEIDMLAKIEKDIREIVLPKVVASYPKAIQKYFDTNYTLFVNPTGKFVIGGPHGDTGLTGRKIIVDTYGGRGSHGGGAFSGKDASKVDRSAAYAARHIAKNMVAAGVADEVHVQLAYAIGIAEPVGLYVNLVRSNVNLSEAEVADKIKQIFDLRPFAIIKRLGLHNPIFEETAAYGHMGRTPSKKLVSINGVEKSVETFTWEKLDYVNEIKKVFNLQ